VCFGTGVLRRILGLRKRKGDEAGKDLHNEELQILCSSLSRSILKVIRNKDV
jgi:hypothetical protein